MVAMDNDSNVVRFPISADDRKRNQYGKGFVPCEVSNRWLQFNSFSLNGSIMVNVMTDSSGQPRKITELVLKREDLVSALLNTTEIHE